MASALNHRVTSHTSMTDTEASWLPRYPMKRRPKQPNHSQHGVWLIYPALVYRRRSVGHTCWQKNQSSTHAGHSDKSSLKLTSILTALSSSLSLQDIIGWASRSLSLFGWLLNKKAARVKVNISLAFLYWVGIAPVSYTHLTLPTIYSV